MLDDKIDVMGLAYLCMVFVIPFMTYSGIRQKFLRRLYIVYAIMTECYIVYKFSLEMFDTSNYASCDVIFMYLILIAIVAILIIYVIVEAKQLDKKSQHEINDKPQVSFEDYDFEDYDFEGYDCEDYEECDYEEEDIEEDYDVDY